MPSITDQSGRRVGGRMPCPQRVDSPSVFQGWLEGYFSPSVRQRARWHTYRFPPSVCRSQLGRQLDFTSTLNLKLRHPSPTIAPKGSGAAQARKWQHRVGGQGCWGALAAQPPCHARLPVPARLEVAALPCLGTGLLLLPLCLLAPLVMCGSRAQATRVAWGALTGPEDRLACSRVSWHITGGNIPKCSPCITR